MPANLTPQYLEAERRYRQATTPEEQLAALEAMMAVIPKHKGTEHMRADIRRRMAKARTEAARRKTAGGKGPTWHHVPREGAGQVVLVGPPNAGKSRLLAALSNAAPVVAPYPFSTRMPLPGMVPFEDVQVQLVDLPPIAPETAQPWLLALVRLEILREAWGARFEILPVSVETGAGLETLRRELFGVLRVIRVYTKAPGRRADRSVPFVLPRGATVADACAAVHKDFVERLKYARIWGARTFEGQMVQREHVLDDGDVIELHV